ncbi:MAG: DUF4019 domain-containing protein [Deltaproteobacteria bacterium]|nr:DUF4019 domain-containing protein [Deltaproteobacteria bacterium]
MRTLLRHLSRGAIFGLLIVWALPTIAADDTKQVVDMAQKWLTVVDSGNYVGAWEQASALIKGAVDKNGFATQVAGVRKPLGKVVTRTLKTSKLETALPGAPDGHYLVMQFDTVFENKKVTVETVTFTHEKDGQWRSAGYFIK